MIDPLLDTLEKLSDAATKALPYLEKYDYRKETRTLNEDNLPLDVLPKPLKEITDSLLIYCITLINRNDSLPKNRLLNKNNIARSIENLNISGDRSSISQIQFIRLDPIKDIADCLEEIGLNRQSGLIFDAYEFGQALRKFKADNTNGNTKISPVFIFPEDELSKDEQLQAKNYDDFRTIFKHGALASSQKRAIYDSFLKLLSNKNQENPHLIVMAAILLLMNVPAFGKPLTGTLNHIRSVVYKSLGLPESTAKSYSKNSLNKNASPSLRKYKAAADALLKLALGNTR